LPRTPVFDTAIHGNDLIVATHGRAFWSLDNITPLRQASTQIASQPVYLYQPATAVRFHGGGGFGGRQGGASALNPPNGAVIDFYLASAPTTPVTLQITDAGGRVVHRVSSEEPNRDEESAAEARGSRGGRGRSGAGLRARAGMNRYVWNFRVEGATPLPGIFISEIQGGGPTVPPGTYRVTLTADGKTYNAPLQITADPRVHASLADLQKQYELALTLRDRVSELHEIVMQIRAARATLTNVRPAADSSRQQAIDAAQQKMADLESALTQVKSTSQPASLVYPIMLDAQYADLMNVVESADSAPPAQVYAVFHDYEQRREQLLSQWKSMQASIPQLERGSGSQASQR
jgi:hypothetical protein